MTKAKYMATYYKGYDGAWLIELKNMNNGDVQILTELEFHERRKGELYYTPVKINMKYYNFCNGN